MTGYRLTGDPRWDDLLRQEYRRAKEAAAAFRDATVAGDAEAFYRALEAVDITGCWQEAFRGLAGAGAPAAFRRRFMAVWQQDGDTLRSSVTDDAALATGLRALLPPYRGGDVILYRGEGFPNRRRRTYGLSWTSDIRVARAFAESRAAIYQGGAVLLKTFAPAEAVISRTPGRSERFGYEAEYIVDRRLLKEVSAVERFPAPE